MRRSPAAFTAITRTLATHFAKSVGRDNEAYSAACARKAECAFPYAPQPSSRSKSRTASTPASSRGEGLADAARQHEMQRAVAHLLVPPHVPDQRRGREPPVQHPQFGRQPIAAMCDTTRSASAAGQMPQPRRQPERQAQADGDALAVQQVRRRSRTRPPARGRTCGRGSAARGRRSAFPRARRRRRPPP